MLEEENNLLDFELTNSSNLPTLNTIKNHINEIQFASFIHKSIKIDNSENSLPKLWFKKRNIMEIFPQRDKLIGMFAVRLKNIG